MKITQLIAELSQPQAFRFPVKRVEVVQTHISAVFLVGEYVYKIKKPVQLGFLDFGSLAQRRHFCEQEVLLNRRLAPQVYLGVVPVTRGTDGRLRLEGEGEPVEWAVKMRHLPEEATLESQLARNEVDAAVMAKLAGRIADFHRQAASNEHIQEFGRFAVVAGNARENFTQSAGLVGITVSQPVFDRIRDLTEQQLRALETLIEDRATRGVPRDTHGDLRLDHVYLFPDRPPPDDVVILDCIEFNERFRFADPIADMAFLEMDLLVAGHRDLARAFAEAYLQAAGDEEGRRLVAYYTAYRAVVRGKVEGFKLTEREVPPEEKEIALGKAHAHWLLALGELEERSRRPCLVLVGGLPGAGKSTLARALAERAGFTILRTDVIRKELAGVAPDASLSTAFKAGIYTAEWTERTYRECLRRATDLLFEGKRVLVDASFRHEYERRLFLQTALHWGVPGLFLQCQVSPETVRQRLLGRKNDASDADWNIYLQSAQEWESAEKDTQRHTRELDANSSPEELLAQALHCLRQAELV